MCISQSEVIFALVRQAEEEVIRRRAGMVPLFSSLKQGGKSAGRRISLSDCLFTTDREMPPVLFVFDGIHRISRCRLYDMRANSQSGDNDDDYQGSEE
jgi:hypothetical protein